MQPAEHIRTGSKEMRRRNTQSRSTLVAILVFLLAAAAHGQVTNIQIVTQPAPADTLPGYIVNDVVIDFVGQYTGSQLYLELSSGEIYQNAAGGNTAPSSLIAPLVPGLQWDTFVTQGTEFSDTSNGVPALGGGAVSLADLTTNSDNLGRPISSSSTFSSELINQQYNPSAGLIIEDQSDFMVARITLSNDANGQVLFAGFSSPDAENPVSPDVAPRLNLPIVNGAIIPEPSSVALLGIGLLVGLVTLKRR
jgi:hypothetical protein